MTSGHDEWTTTPSGPVSKRIEGSWGPPVTPPETENNKEKEVVPKD